MTTATAAPVLDLAPRIEDCFLFDAIESSYDVPAYRGLLPAWLRGTWYINGPARFQYGGRQYKHWLDGDGMVCALQFGADAIRFTNRFVRTRKFEEEQRAGRFIYRGFGTSFAGDRLRRNVMLEPPVNVSVYPYDGRVLALGEQTLPFELDPETLETRGEYDFHGSLNELTPFAAHAKVFDSLLNFGISFSAIQPMLNTYEFDTAGHLQRRRRYRLDHPHSLHDFGFTLRHMVFFLSPLLMKFERFWRDGASVMESLDWQPQLGSRILIAPRTGCADPVFTIEAGDGYCLHVINCFETSTRLTVDLLLFDSPVYPEYQPVPDMFVTAPRCRPVRYEIDLENQQLLLTRIIDYDVCPDFPAIDPARAGCPYNDFWMLGMSKRDRAGRKFFDQLAHGSWERGGMFDIFETPEGEYVAGEPAFVANPGDGNEAVIIVEYLKPANHSTEIALFDAFAVRKGPIASIPLRYPVHPGFHSSFAHRR
jgi:all-trans-8'-apo-beta-carotenal 15,15'-oxygenase